MPPFWVPVMHKYLRTVHKIESYRPPALWNLGRIWAEKRAESE